MRGAGARKRIEHAACFAVMCLRAILCHPPARVSILFRIYSCFWIVEGSAFAEPRYGCAPYRRAPLRHARRAGVLDQSRFCAMPFFFLNSPLAHGLLYTKKYRVGFLLNLSLRENLGFCRLQRPPQARQRRRKAAALTKFKLADHGIYSCAQAPLGVGFDQRIALADRMIAP